MPLPVQRRYGDTKVLVSGTSQPFLLLFHSYLVRQSHRPASSTLWTLGPDSTSHRWVPVPWSVPTGGFRNGISPLRTVAFAATQDTLLLWVSTDTAPPLAPLSLTRLVRMQPPC